MAVLFLCVRNEDSHGEVCNGDGLGYLTSPSSSPGYILRPSSIFLQPGRAKRNSFEGSFDMQWANVWCYDPDHYMLDGEWIRADARIQYGLTDDFSMGVVLPVMGRAKGFADSAIENFHDTFGLSNADREQFPQNQSRIWVKTDDGATRDVAEGESWGIGDVAVFAVMKNPGWWATPSIMLQCSLPTGDEEDLEGLGSPSLSLSSVAAKRIGKSPVHAFAGIGVSYCPEDELAGIELNPFVYSGLLGLEYQIASRWSLVTQMLSSSPMAEDFGEFSDPCHELSAGFKWRTGESGIMEFAVVENLFSFKNSSDIAVHFSVGRKL